MSYTRTYVVMGISQGAHAEIMGNMIRAGYQHAISSDGKTIDMHGIAVEPEESSIAVEGDGIEIHTDGTIIGKRERVEEFRAFCAARGKLLS